MKKAIAISFLLIFLLANTELQQVLKLPVLVHHYLEHRLENSGKSLLAFLHDHYAEEHAAGPSNHHHRDHEGLPFKSHNNTSGQATVFYSPAVLFDYSLERPLSAIETFDYSAPFHGSSALSKIWQPPRAC